ncbi:hypothetical protein MXD81_19750, partial [Microbacteriaceae bacterium K1510]|nr:hypothetical protein [Microbacteriaceae bacterium K1510]
MEIRHSKLFTYANSPFGNKWNVTQLLMEDEQVRQWLPKTVAYSAAMLRRLSKEFPLLYLKPGNGTGGRSILKITKRSKGFGLLGSSKKLERKA